MMLDLSTIPFLQARWYTQTNGRVIDLVVLHDMEFYERPDSAEWCANFFATSDRVGSTHYATDNDSIVGCVREHDVCYGANGVNHNGIHIEMAGFAGQSAAEWTDDYSIATMVKTASLTAALCVKYTIPIVYVDAAGLLRGERGITTHRSAEIAFPYGGHSDPGENFPMDRFISMVRSMMESQAQLADWIAACLGDEARSVDGPRGKVVEVRLRDHNAEKAAQSAWMSGHNNTLEGFTFTPIFLWAPLGAGIQWTHYAASVDNE